LKNYFELTSAQRVGVAVWSVIIILMIALLNVNFRKDHADPFAVSDADLEYVHLNATQSRHFYTDNYSNSWKQESPALFEFDPNAISLTDWQNLGFSVKQAQAIIDYRDEKGPFKIKQDLKKVYVISDEKYAELEPYVLLENGVSEPESRKVIDLNTASAADFEALPMIGEKYAEMIVKRRSMLGGFTSVTQLHEVYGMSEETYQILAENVVLESMDIKKINLNTATKDEIDRHPYIDFAMTAAILKKRDEEKIESLDFLLEKQLITEEKKKELEPYIEF
jgi:competence protein ComEA